MKERITRTQRLLGETQVYVILTVAKVSWVYTQILKLIKLHFKCVQFTAFQLQLSKVAAKKGSYAAHISKRSERVRLPQA